MAATKKTLDVYRIENEADDWRWTLTQAGRIIDASSEGYSRRAGVDANILSVLAINLKAVDWTRDDKIVKQGTVKRWSARGTGAAGLTGQSYWAVETVHVTIWKRK